MYTEGFKPPRPGGTIRPAADEFINHNSIQRDVDISVEPYRKTVEPDFKIRETYFYDEVG